MAWRIDEQVIRGEIDNRRRGRVTGRIWLIGREDAVEVDLAGDCWRDLAGHFLRFTNPAPKACGPEGLAPIQDGHVGDITASRKVKVPNCSDEELQRCLEAHEPFPWYWGNSLYLEWFSTRNGRVVIETTDYELEVDPEPAWTMTAAEEDEQRVVNARNLTRFMERLASGNAMPAGEGRDDEEIDDDEPQSRAEAEADAESARMNLLLDRVTARLDREGGDDDDFDRIYEEERERLRRERGEPEERPLTPEEEAERARWIADMNAAAEEAMADAERESWKGEDPFESRDHPLVERCRDWAVELHRDAEEWLPDEVQREHPLVEIVTAAMSASAKFAGALNGRDEWPPDPITAGDSLVRLKKAREYLRDTLRAFDSADEEQLAPADWRARHRREASELLGEAQAFIEEVRRILAEEE